MTPLDASQRSVASSSDDPFALSAVAGFSGSDPVSPYEGDTETEEEEASSPSPDEVHLVFEYVRARCSNPERSPAKVLSPGRVQRGRKFLRSSRGAPIGKGAQGQVSVGFSPMRRMPFAIKQGAGIGPEVSFYREVLRKRRKIPHTVHVMDAFPVKGIATGAIFMEKLKGDLEKFLEKKSLSPQEVKRILRQLLEAFSQMQGIVHGDVKPENVLVRCSFEEVKEALLADFGVAQCTDLGKENKLHIQTIGYRAPEVYFARGYSEKADLWGLGAILFKMVTRKSLIVFPPFSQRVGSAPLEFYSELSEIMQIACNTGGMSRENLEGYFSKFRKGVFPQDGIDRYFQKRGDKYMPRFGSLYDPKEVAALQVPWMIRLRTAMQQNPSFNQDVQLQAEINRVFHLLTQLDPSRRPVPSSLLESFYPKEEACVHVALGKRWPDTAPVRLSLQSKTARKVEQTTMSLLARPECCVHVPFSGRPLAEELSLALHSHNGVSLAQADVFLDPSKQRIVLASSEDGKVRLKVQSKFAEKRRMQPLEEEEDPPQAKKRVHFLV